MALLVLGGIGLFCLTIGSVCLVGAIRGQGLSRKLRRLVIGVVFLGIGGLCVGVQMALRAFESFTTTTLVATVQCRWLGPKQFELTWLPARGDWLKKPIPMTVRLRGDQWSVSGGIVKWHPWLTALGLPSYHQPTRITGRYASPAEEARNPPTVFTLNQEPDPLWWWFYRFDQWLPFVEATYGSAAYTYVNPALAVEVQVTPGGYLITSKPRERPKPSTSKQPPASRP